MDKYKNADRRLAELLHVENAHWTQDSAAVERLSKAHGITLEVEDDCCCAHHSGPTSSWIWYRDHISRDLAINYSVVMSIILKLEGDKNE